MAHSTITFTAGELSTYYASRLPNLKQVHSAEWRGPCPIHGGTRDSFAVQRLTGCWFCHSDCNRGGGIIELERALGNTDFRTARDEVFRIVGRVSSLNRNTRAKWHSTATYTYTDEMGSPLFRIFRLEPDDRAARDKKFYIERFESGSWIKGLGSTRRVPYHLPAILNAEQVFISEGEKDADTVAAMGLVSTTCPLGAGKWTGEYSPYFKGKHAIVLMDNDDAGRAHATQVATEILPVAATVRVLELPDLPPKGDVSDWRSSGGTREQLLELVGRTPCLTEGTLEELIRTWKTERSPANNKNRPQARSFPFEIKDEGVFFLKEDRNGSLDRIRLAARVDVVAATRDIAGENWGRWLTWRDEEGRLHKWAMPMELLASDAGAVRTRLFSEGLPFIATSANLREKFIEYLQTAPTHNRVRSVARMGWHDGAYVLPDYTIAAEGSEDVLYQTPHEVTHHWRVNGDAAGWRANIGYRCSGNSRLIIAVSAGFAGPLLSLVNAESGGIHFHGATSSGKTTALLVGGSVCGGGGPAGFLQTWRTTINGLEAMAEAHNDGTLFLDELAQVDPADAASVAYLLGNGQGKARMTRNIGVRTRLRWTLLFVSAGETTLAEHAASAGKNVKGGAEVRLLNIEAEAGQFGLFEELHGTTSPDAFARALKEAALRYYGTPFRAFLELLTSKRGEVEKLIRKAREEFINRFAPAGSSGEVKRAAERFALIGAAGELATEWDLTGWQDGEAIRAAERCLREWVAGRGTTGASDMEGAVRQVRAFFEINGSSRFQPLKSSVETNPERIMNRAGFTRSNVDGETEYLILPEVFRREVCRGHSHQAVLRELDKRGFLVRDPENLTIKPRLPELGSVRVYCIRAAILNGGEC
jgi:putative DNA primase/helicase